MLEVLHAGSVDVMRAKGREEAVTIDCACVLLVWARERASGPLPNKRQTRLQRVSIHTFTWARSACAALRHSKQSWIECDSHGVLDPESAMYAPRILGRRRKAA